MQMKTRNSSVADKPRDAFVHMKWCGWPPHTQKGSGTFRSPERLSFTEGKFPGTFVPGQKFVRRSSEPTRSDPPPMTPY